MVPAAMVKVASGNGGGARCLGFAGEVASARAEVRATTRDGKRVSATLVGVYQFVGNDACSLAPGLDRVSRHTTSWSADVAHTWWPRHTHLYAAMGPTWDTLATRALTAHDSEQLSRPGATYRLMTAVIYDAVAASGLYGAVPLAFFGRMCKEDAAVCTTWPATASPTHRLGLGRLFADDAEREIFCETAGDRDAAMTAVFSRGLAPYSYEGVQVMSRVLRHRERWYALQCRDDMVKSMRDLRHQLYLSRRVGCALGDKRDD
jgi:hypothetical protein